VCSSVPFLLADHFCLQGSVQLRSERTPCAARAGGHGQFPVPDQNLESPLGSMNLWLCRGGSQQKSNEGLHLFPPPGAGSSVGVCWAVTIAGTLPPAQTEEA